MLISGPNYIFCPQQPMPEAKMAEAGPWDYNGSIYVITDNLGDDYSFVLHKNTTAQGLEENWTVSTAPIFTNTWTSINGPDRAAYNKNAGLIAWLGYNVSLGITKLWVYNVNTGNLAEYTPPAIGAIAIQDNGTIGIGASNALYIGDGNNWSSISFGFGQFFPLHIFAYNGDWLTVGYGVTDLYQNDWGFAKVSNGVVISRARFGPAWQLDSQGAGGGPRAVFAQDRIWVTLRSAYLTYQLWRSNTDLDNPEFTLFDPPVIDIGNAGASFGPYLVSQNAPNTGNLYYLRVTETRDNGGVLTISGMSGAKFIPAIDGWGATEEGFYLDTEVNGAGGAGSIFELSNETIGWLSDVTVREGVEGCWACYVNFALGGGGEVIERYIYDSFTLTDEIALPGSFEINLSDTLTMRDGRIEKNKSGEGGDETGIDENNDGPVTCDPVPWLNPQDQEEVINPCEQTIWVVSNVLD